MVMVNKLKIYLHGEQINKIITGRNRTSVSRQKAVGFVFIHLGRVESHGRRNATGRQFRSASTWCSGFWGLVTFCVYNCCDYIWPNVTANESARSSPFRPHHFGPQSLRLLNLAGVWLFCLFRSVSWPLIVPTTLI